MARPFSVDDPLRLYIVEDHALTIQGIKAAFASERKIKIVGTCTDGAEAVRCIPKSETEVVLMDLSLPEMNGMQATRHLLRLGTALTVIWYSAYPVPEFIQFAKSLGVRGLVHKSCSDKELLKAIFDVWSGKEVFSKTVFCERLRLEGAEVEKTKLLSNRQREVLILIANGMITKEVADVLQMSPRTVEGHREQICRKLELRNQSEMVRWAVKAGLVS